MPVTLSQRSFQRFLGSIAAVMAVAAVAVPGAFAHEFTITRVRATFTSEGTYRIDMTVDIDALALGVSPSLDSTLLAEELRAMPAEELAACVQRAKRTIQRRVRLRFDGEREIPNVEFPGADAEESPGIDQPTVLGVTARLLGAVPATAREFTFGASKTFGPVQLTLHDQSVGVETSYALRPSEDSPPYHLGKAIASSGRFDVARRYLVFGFEHILPKGADHILFVLGLFLLSTKWRPLLWQITAFTIAHSVTLALSMYGVVELPSRVVETLIAGSIAYVGIENMITSELKPWRPAMVFGFGLLHGLGFAGVLRELALPRDQFVTALFSFNVGVEVGQLAVVALAFLAVGWFRRSNSYRRLIVVPLSAAIAAAGLYWSVVRSVGIG